MKNDETSQPPLRYELNLGGVKHLLTEGVAVKLPGLKPGATISLEPLPERQFQAAGVSFEYPAEFKFEYKEKEDDEGEMEERTWEVSGNNFSIVLHEFFTEGGLLKIIEDQFFMGKEQSQSEGKRKANGQTYEVRKLSYKTMGFEFKPEIWILSEAPRGLFLVMQTYEDAPFDKAPISSQMLALLDKTLVVQKT